MPGMNWYTSLSRGVPKIQRLRGMKTSQECGTALTSQFNSLKNCKVLEGWKKIGKKFKKKLKKCWKKVEKSFKKIEKS